MTLDELTYVCVHCSHLQAILSKEVCASAKLPIRRIPEPTGGGALAKRVTAELERP